MFKEVSFLHAKWKQIHVRRKRECKQEFYDTVLVLAKRNLHLILEKYGLRIQQEENSVPKCC